MSPERWQRVKELFDAALAQEQAVRSDFLHSACGDDDDLREQVLTLLTSHEQAGSFIAQPVFEDATSLIIKKSSDSLDGRRLSHYQLHSMLGKGGMGEVYLATDVRLGRKAALKVLPAEFANNADLMQRFVQEARAASALNHPNIITVYEVGEDKDVRFMATEFVEGQTLRNKINARALSLNAVLEIAIQIANALVAAHEAGIVHRDIKPENVMLRPDGIVKVLDFGLAKLVEQVINSAEFSSSPQTRVKTQSGIIVGTINYLSPEQARGRAVDARSDLFSLGVLIYEMLSGSRPFEGETMSDVLAAVLKAEPPPLSNVPDELQRIVFRTLRKERDERYQTARELLGELQQLKQRVEYESNWGQTAEPIEERRAGAPTANRQREMETAKFSPAKTSEPAGQPTKLSRSVPLPSRRSLKLVGLVAIMLILGVGLGWFYFFRGADDGETSNSIAVLPFANLSGDANLEYLSDGIPETIINNLSQLPRLKVMSRASTFRYKGREIDPLEIGRVFNVRTVLFGQLVKQGNDLVVKLELVDTREGQHIWGGQFPRTIPDMLALQAMISQEVLQKLRPKLSGDEKQRVTQHQTVNPEAYQSYLKGRFYMNQLTEVGLKRGIEYFNQALAKDPDYALAYAGLSYCYVVLGSNYKPAREVIPSAKVYAQKALALDDALADAYYTMAGISYGFDWDWAKVEQETQRTLELNPNHADAFSLSGHLLQTLGRPQEAIAKFQRALELDPFSLLLNHNLTQAYYVARQYDQALEQGRKTIELAPDNYIVYLLIGQTRVQQGKFAEAFDSFEKARALAGDAPTVLTAFGQAYAVTGKTSEAQQMLSRLQQLPPSQYVRPHEVAAIYVALNQHDQAFLWLNKAYDARAAFLLLLKVEPQFDNLRQDPRYADLLHRMGLTP